MTDDETMEAAAAEAVHEMDGRGRVPINNPASELARLTGSIDRLYDQKQKELTDLLARHALERTAMANDFNRHMAELQQRADASRKALNKRQNDELEPLRLLVDRLEVMRET